MHQPIDPFDVVLLHLQEAQKAIAAAKKDIKQTSKELNSQLTEMEELLNTNLRRAERENSTVYLQRVPNIADLPAIQPHSVARCALSVGSFAGVAAFRRMQFISLERDDVQSFPDFSEPFAIFWNMLDCMQR